MFKFLKKFKDKILIALACCFIGIGTILCNTLETKAYVSDETSYTLNEPYYDSSLYGGTTIFDLKSSISNAYAHNLYLCINMANPSEIYATAYLYIYSNNSWYNLGSRSFQFFNYNPYTFIMNISTNSNTFQNITKVGIRFNVGFGGTWTNYDFVKGSELTNTFYLNSYSSQLQNQYDTLQAEYTSYQNTHAYTNEQYNNLMSQNASLTLQVQSLQSQYDTYVSLHSYTNEQYNTLLTNYNNLQTMYNNLQQQYLDLQQRYNELNLLLSPFIDNVWTRSATLNGQTIDISSSSYHNNVVSFNGTYLEIYPYDMDIYSSYIQGKNDFQMIATSNSTITIGNYTAIAPLSHSLDDGFRIEFYLDNNIVFSSNWFDNDMTASDGSSSTDTYSSVVPVTFNRFILYLEASTGSGGFTSYSYFKATTGSFNDGYNYAVEQLQPRINDLENGLEQAINQQQVKYSEGYNAGFDARIIHNLYTE